MSRNEFEDTSDISQPELTIDVDYFHANGLLSAKPDNKIVVCAKRIKNNETNTIRLYILTEGGELYDPQAISPTYRKRNWKFKLTTETIFTLYLKYLGYGSALDKFKHYIKKKAERLL
jgi:hypothetical protein